MAPRSSSGRGLQTGEPDGIGTLRRQSRLQRLGLPPAADEGDIVGIGRQRRLQRGLVTAPLSRDHDESIPTPVLRQGIALDAPVRLGEGALLGGRRADGEVEADAPAEIGDRHGDGAGATDDELRPGDHRLDEDVHRAAARAHVAGEADAGPLLTRLYALGLQTLLRLNRDQPRLAIRQRLARRLHHRGARAAAADPAFCHPAIGADHRLGPGLGGGGGDRAHHRGQREGLALGPHRRDQIEDVRRLPSCHQILAR